MAINPLPQQPGCTHYEWLFGHSTPIQARATQHELACSTPAMPDRLPIPCRVGTTSTACWTKADANGCRRGFSTTRSFAPRLWHIPPNSSHQVLSKSSTHTLQSIESRFSWGFKVTYTAGSYIRHTSC